MDEKQKEFRIRYIHYRPDNKRCFFSRGAVMQFAKDALNLKQIKPKTHRGKAILDSVLSARAVTICVIHDKNRNVLATGYAFCSPLDNFCRKEGRAIAEDRAFKMMQEAA